MASEVIPFGYQPDIVKGYGRLDAIMSVPKTVLIDIRLVASCPSFPAWDGESLEDHYGHDAQGKAKYIHLSALGNLNYRKEDRDKGFSLKAARIGLDKLKAGLDAGYRLVLLCGCRDYSYCHRSLVVQLLAAEVPGLVVAHPDEIERHKPVAATPAPIVVEQAALFDVPAVWRDI
jgi:uncharacterized protein (DUF488 family)